MKTGHETPDAHLHDSHVPDAHLEDRIDRTLHFIGSAEPRPGIEKRIAARLAHASVAKSARPFGLARRTLASAAGMAACAAIIAGSVTHSHRMVPVAPGVPLPIGGSAGVGAASAARAATRPVAAPSPGRARAMRKVTGVGDVRKPDGVAVPRTPLLQENTPQANAKPQSR